MILRYIAIAALVIHELFGVLWLIAAVALVGSGVALALRPGLWPILPIVGAILSLAAIVPWWRTVVPGAKAGAAFDGIVLAALLPPWSGQVMALLGI